MNSFVFGAHLGRYGSEIQSSFEAELYREQRVAPYMKSDDSPFQTQYEQNNAFGRVHSVCPTAILIGSTLNKLGLPMDPPSAYTLELSPFPTLSTAVRINAWGIYNAINLVLLSSLSQVMLITRPCLAEPPQLFASPLDTQLGPCRCEVMQLRDEMQRVQISEELSQPALAETALITCLRLPTFAYPPT